MFLAIQPFYWHQLYQNNKNNGSLELVCVPSYEASSEKLVISRVSFYRAKFVLSQVSLYREIPPITRVLS